MNWQKTRLKVLERDNHKCRYIQCLANQRLHVHHINGNKDDNRMENLITLCGVHHKYSEPRDNKKDVETTTIQIEEETRDELRKLIKIKGETYDVIIKRLIKQAKS